MFKATHTEHAPWVVVDFNDQRRGRLTLIRHLLDHVPDYRLPDEPLELPPLKGKPARERFRGPVKPLRARTERGLGPAQPRGAERFSAFPGATFACTAPARFLRQTARRPESGCAIFRRLHEHPMHYLNEFFTALNGIVWGVPMIVLILGTGLYLQLRLGFMPILHIAHGFRMVWKSRQPGAAGEGEISPYAALMTALSATIGTGNIIGVATAISVGGPGALFWMWMTGASAWPPSTPKVSWRSSTAWWTRTARWPVGPCTTSRTGLERWRWLGVLFALFGCLAAFGIGNMVQANGISSAIQNALGGRPG